MKGVATTKMERGARVKEEEEPQRGSYADIGGEAARRGLQQPHSVGQEAGAVPPAMPLSPACYHWWPHYEQVHQIAPLSPARCGWRSCYAQIRRIRVTRGGGQR